MNHYRIVSTQGNLSEIQHTQNLFRTIFQRLVADDIDTIEIRDFLEKLASATEKITKKEFPNLHQHPKYELNQCFRSLNDKLDKHLSKSQFADVLSYPVISTIYGSWRAIARLTAVEPIQMRTEEADRSVAEAVVRIIAGHKNIAVVFRSHDMLTTLRTAAERSTNPTTITAIARAIGHLVLVDREPLAGPSLITESTRNTLLALAEKATTDTERAAISMTFQAGLPKRHEILDFESHNAFTHEHVKKMLIQLATESTGMETQQIVLATLNTFIALSRQPQPRDRELILELLTHLDKKNSQALSNIFPALQNTASEK